MVCIRMIYKIKFLKMVRARPSMKLEARGAVPPHNALASAPVILPLPYAPVSGLGRVRVCPCLRLPVHKEASSISQWKNIFLLKYLVYNQVPV